MVLLRITSIFHTTVNRCIPQLQKAEASQGASAFYTARLFTHDQKQTKSFLCDRKRWNMICRFQIINKGICNFAKQILDFNVFNDIIKKNINIFVIKYKSQFIRKVLQ